MKVAASIELVWQLAARETAASEFKDIEPDHFFEALLKFSELPVDEVRNIAAGAEVARELAEEVNRVREEFESRNIDTTRVRRALRERLGRGQNPYDGGTLHRSPATRELFDAAARLADDAGSDTLQANHFVEVLLSSPTPAMADVLGDAVGHLKPGPGKTPLLFEHGRDLTRMASAGPPETGSTRATEGKALLRAVSESGRQGVFLVTDDDEAAVSVVRRAAHAIVMKECPKDLRRKRIVDVTAVKPAGGNDDTSRELLKRLIAEAGGAGDVILFLPPLETSSPDEWVDDLAAVLTEQTVQCICRLGNESYDKRVERNPVWKPLAHVMWIHEESAGEVPTEL